MIKIILLVLLVAVLYWDTAYELIKDWFSDQESFGLVLLGWAAYLVYNHRNALRALTPSVWWPGIAVIFASLLLYLLGQASVEYYSQRISLILLLTGIITFLYGIQVFKALFFPIVLLFLAVPLPAVVVNQATFPLKTIVSFLSENVFHALSIPVFREGNILRLPGLALEVVNACSGIRSIFALLAVGVFMSNGISSIRRKLRFLLFIVAVAIVTNVLRITVTGTVHWMGFSGAVFQFFHGFGGWLFFMLALYLTWLFRNAFTGPGLRSAPSGGSGDRI